VAAAEYPTNNELSNLESLSYDIIIKGSDTVLPLSQLEAEDFMMENPDASVTVIGGGSGVGIAALIEGEVEIAMTSRKIKESELQSATENGVNPIEHVIAIDGIAVVVNPQNPVANLTYTQLRGIFNGTINNWADVGGENLPITVIIRDSSSGTYEFFKEEVLIDDEYRPDSIVQPATGAIVQEVAQSTRAIGYIGFAYLDETVSALALDNGQGFIEATEENVLNEDYPLARPLQYYTNGEPTGLTKEFIDFVLSTTGQEIVYEAGYFPVESEDTSSNLPIATILSISPNPTTYGESVTFTGSGTDTNGTVVGYKWISSIDGYLNNSSSFSTSKLSTGTHTIYFRVQNDNGEWSDAVSTILLVGYSASPTEILIAGSITIQPFSELVAKEFMAENPNVKITVQGGGSGAAITSTELDIIDIGSADETVDTVNDHPLLQVHQIGGAAVVVITNEGSALDGHNITQTELAQIYSNVTTSGTVTVDATSDNITYIGTTTVNVYQRAEASGTEEIFAKYLGGQFKIDKYVDSSNAISVLGNAGVLEAVAGDSGNALGFVDFGYANDDNSGVTILGVDCHPSNKDDCETEIFKALAGDSTANFPADMARPLNYLTKGAPSTVEQAFIDFVKSTRGQEIVEEVGYLSINGSIFEETDPEETEVTDEISITGSNTVLPISTLEAEEFMYRYLDSVITVKGGGSGVGIAALIDGTTNIAQTSRRIKDSEITEAENNGVDPIEHVIAWDAIAVVVNPENSVTKITFNDLRGIYNGTITNWEEVGGEDSKITVIGRDSASGNYEFFKEEVLGEEDFTQNAYALPSNGLVKEAVVGNTQGIGYIGYAYLDENVKALSLDAGEGYVEAIPENIVSGEYPLARTLQYYTDGEPTGLTKEFIDFVLSTTGQEIVYEAGYFPVADAEETVTEETSSSSNGGGGSTSKTTSGGGGGGTTGEDAENIVFKDVLSLYAGKDDTMNFYFDNENNDIKYVCYGSLKNAGKIAVTIEVLDDTSTFVDNEPTGIIYKNINIWVGKTGYATESNIYNPVVGFKVSKKWIQENDIDSSTVSLNRYNGKEWEALNTKMIDSDENYFYFEAGTSGFSPFAISCETVSNEPVIEETIMKSVDDELVNENVEERTLEIETAVQKKPSKIMEIIDNILHFINKCTDYL
jgi:phosphate transport system substrate-binding protein